MKFKYHLFLLILLNTPLLSKGQTQGFFNHFLITNSGGSDLYNNSNGSAIAGTPFCAGSTVLLGGENHTFENNNCGVSSVIMFYRIFPSGSPSGSFNTMNLTFVNTGPPLGDKFWQISSTNNGPMTTNLLSGLSGGNYTIEFYYEATAGCNGGPNFIIYDSNGGANFTNTFTVIDIPSTPTITTTPATCSAAGSGSISNYNAAYTYTFSNGGLSAGPAINGAVAGTTYTVSASNGACGPSPTASFTNPVQLATPTAPTSLNASVTQVCINNPVNLTGNCASGTLQWFSDAGLTSPISSPVTPITGGISSGIDNVYYATCENNGCKSSSMNITVKSYNCPLPVKLLSFSGNQLENLNQINWTVSNMVNFDRFELEKSSNAISFEKIHTVLGEKNNLTQHSFSVKDTFASIGNNYYRLKMIDKDGSLTYSKIIAIKFEVGAEYAFIENPVKNNTIFLKTNIESPMVKVWTTTGSELPISIIKKNGFYNISMKESTVSGNYILKVFGKTKAVSLRLLID